jgi:hypothetical protein
MFPSSVYDGGVYPLDIATGDFNHDGLADLVVVNQGQSSHPAEVRVLLGNGDGSFHAMPPLTLTGTASSVTVGDLNGDGVSDAVVSNGGPFAVLLSNGDGTFHSAAPITTSNPNPRGLLGDFTGDGKLDFLLITGGLTQAAYELLTGVGDGTFTHPATGLVALPPISGASIAGDINNDGRLDFMTGMGSNPGGRAYLNNGNGTFTQVTATGDGIFKTAVLVDMDRDGKLDLVRGEGGSTATGQLSMYRGNGNGTFQSPPAWTLTWPSGVESITSGDINGDGWPDLVAANDDQDFAVFGTGGGAVSLHETFDPGGLPTRLTLGDFDGQPGRDLAVVCINDYSAYVLLSDADGSFQRLHHNPQPLPISFGFAAAVLADFNGDGIDDTAGVHCQAPGLCTEIAVAPGLAGGGFGAATLNTVGNLPDAMTVTDLNGDGNPDLVVTNIESSEDLVTNGTLSILLGVGNGSFLPQIQMAIGYNPKAVAAADLNGDGRQDVIVLVLGDPAQNIPSGVETFRGNGNGTLTAQPGFTVGLRPRDIFVGDLTGDGRPDIAAITGGTYPALPATVELLRGNGTFSPVPPVVVGQGSVFQALLAGDVDRDGDIDLVAIDQGPLGTDPFSPDYGEARVFLNNGTGSFTAGAAPRGGASPFEGRLEDLNGDGVLDLLMVDGLSTDVALLPGRGDGTFGAAERYATFGYLPQLFGRFDTDALPDLFMGGELETLGLLNVARSTPEIRMTSSTNVSWKGVPFAAGYDVVKGSLSVLHVGGLTPSILGCPYSAGPGQAFTDPALPAQGNGFFYLARARKPAGGAGTYDGEAGQAAPRDAAIDASGLACP